MKKLIVVTLLSALSLISANMLAVPAVAAEPGTVHWLNHLDLLPGDTTVETSFNAVNSGVGGGLSGLLITSKTVGDEAIGGGNKVVEMGVAVPPWNLVTGVRVCFELTNPLGSYVNQIRLAQLQNPPATAMVRLDDSTELKEAGPVCVDSKSPLYPINPANGELRLSFRAYFADVKDQILIRSVALNLVPDPDSPLQKQLNIINNILLTQQKQIDSLNAALKNHTHTYLTGKGVGHNNTVAITGTTRYVVPTPYVFQPPVVTPPIVTPVNKNVKTK